MSDMKKNNSELLNEVISFMENIYGSFAPILVNEETRVEEDLGITGDEACEFFIKYGKHFNVDVSNFLLADYFEGEGWDFLSPILVSLGFKKKFVKKIFTVGDLVKGIKAGKLDEDVLGTSYNNEL